MTSFYQIKEQISFLNRLQLMYEKLETLPIFYTDDFNPRMVLDCDTECDLRYHFIVLFDKTPDDDKLKLDAIEAGLKIGINFLKDNVF